MSNNPYSSSPITDTASVIIYSPRTSTDDLIRPLSPTSSLRGIYVRSRPTSMEVPAESLGFDFGGFYQAAFNRTVQQDHQSMEHPFHARSLCSSTLSDENEPIFTPTTSSESSAATSDYTDDEYIQKNAARRTAEAHARIKALHEGHARARKHYAESIAPSVKTTASKNTAMTLRLGCHFNKKDDRGTTDQNIEDIEEGDNLANVPEVMMRDQAQAQNKRSIPLVYRAVTKKVYGVFHRKALSTPEPIQVDPHFCDDSISNVNAALILEPNPDQLIKSSSVSLFTRKRRPTIASQQELPLSKKIFSQRAFSIRRNKNSFPAAPNIVSLTSSSLAIENHACLRRSVSFSGFVDLPELDDELDEATTEATQVATKASVMVHCADVRGPQGCGSDGVDDGYVFERNVE